MVLANPFCQGVSLVAATALYLSWKGRGAGRFIGALSLVLAIVTLATPLFNAEGVTVLFRWWNGRPYTAEALALGAGTGLMLVTMMMWFASYHRIVTSDKFTFLFGRIIPALSLVLTMVLRLVPHYRRKTEALWSARTCIGKGPGAGQSLRARVQAASAVLGLLGTGALEDAVITADSLRSRGYGLPGRTHYALFRWRTRDTCMTVILATLAVAAVALLVPWGFAPLYLPTVTLPPITEAGVLGMVAYGAFLATPALCIWEGRLSWRLSLLRS